jgi:hypothetical protein
LTPFLIAVGAGAALKYFLPVDEKSQTTFVPREQVTSSVHTAEETTPVVSIELPTETRIDITDSRDIAANKTISTTTTLDADSDTNTEIGRTAKL